MFCKKSSCTDLFSACTLQISLRDCSFLLLLLPTISTGSFRATKQETLQKQRHRHPPPTTHKGDKTIRICNSQIPYIKGINQKVWNSKIHTKQNRFHKRERDTHIHIHIHIPIQQIERDGGVGEAASCAWDNGSSSIPLPGLTSQQQQQQPLLGRFCHIPGRSLQGIRRNGNTVQDSDGCHSKGVSLPPSLLCARLSLGLGTVAACHRHLMIYKPLSLSNVPCIAWTVILTTFCYHHCFLFWSCVHYSIWIRQLLPQQEQSPNVVSTLPEESGNLTGSS